MDLAELSLHSIHDMNGEEWQVISQYSEGTKMFIELEKVDEFDKPLSEV